MRRPAYKVGVDGGATKTECVLVDRSGAVVARRRARGCNPSVVGAAEAGRIVTRALGALVRRKGSRLRIDETLLCVAGNRIFWNSFAKSLRGFGRVRAADDSLPVLELATAGGEGLVLHGGTGSFIAARRGRKVHYAGGLGWRFGDPGSAGDIGRRGIARALLEMGGWLPRSGLSALVRKATGLSDPVAISRLFYAGREPEARIASFAKGVLDLAEAGDSAAREAAADSLAEMLELAKAVARKLFPRRRLAALRVGVSGPVLRHPASLRILRSRSPFPLKPVLEPPIEGVRRLLARA